MDQEQNARVNEPFIFPNFDLQFEPDDLNGECFIAGGAGEVEEEKPECFVYFPPDYPYAREGTWRNFENNIPVSAQLTLFIAINAFAGMTVEYRNNDANNNKKIERVKIAYLRSLAVRAGLMSPDFLIGSHNVKYSQTLVVDNTFMNILALRPVDIAFIQDNLTAVLRRNMRRLFTDVVCCIACMFRMRGHHWTQEMDERYDSLWARCLHEARDLSLSWKLMAIDALHAIFPDVLDHFWLTSAENTRCAGALIKRVDCAPAGCAGIFALKRGLADIQMLFPRVVTLVPDAYEHFVQACHLIQQTRWGASINHRFYGVPMVKVNEGEIGVLASVVVGVYKQLAPDSKLLDSEALKRLAQTAPATGGAMGAAAINATRDARMNLLDIVEQQNRQA